MEYAIEQLAQRWHVPPWVIEEGPSEWLYRGLEYQRMEASVKVVKG